jgi:uncharacterized UPF0160 family protein
MNIFQKKSLVLATHGSNFHADDLCATAILKTFFAYTYPDIKLTIIRTLDQKKLDAADIVYDIGKIYNPKKFRFDHHQKGGSGQRENGVQYAAIGLVWKEFGVRICSEHTLRTTGKKATKAQATAQASMVEKRFISHIDAMDNGQMTYTETFVDVSPITLDGYFEMCKVGISSQGKSIPETNKMYDKTFFKLVPMVQEWLQNILTYAIYKEQDDRLAVGVYNKAKDKRIIVGDRFYYFNFGKFPEPLVTVYPDPRGTWAAKNVRKDERSYDARFYFPESWAGLPSDELQKVSGVEGAEFCHNACFLIAGKTKEVVLEMVRKAFEEQGLS